MATAIPVPTGSDGPPFALEVLGAILSLVVIVSAAVAWRSGNRLAVRTNAAGLLLDGLLALPVLFVHVDAGIKLGSAVVIVLTVVAMVLILRPEPQPFAVTD